MKKLKLVILITGLMLTACTRSQKVQQAQEKQRSVCRFICAMDKDVCADKPGTCPKCGMELIKRDNGK